MNAAASVALDQPAVTPPPAAAAAASLAVAPVSSGPVGHLFASIGRAVLSRCLAGLTAHERILVGRVSRGWRQMAAAAEEPDADEPDEHPAWMHPQKRVELESRQLGRLSTRALLLRQVEELIVVRDRNSIALAHQPPRSHRDELQHLSHGAHAIPLPVDFAQLVHLRTLDLHALSRVDQASWTLPHSGLTELRVREMQLCPESRTFLSPIFDATSPLTRLDLGLVGMSGKHRGTARSILCGLVRLTRLQHLCLQSDGEAFSVTRLSPLLRANRSRLTLRSLSMRGESIRRVEMAPCAPVDFRAVSQVAHPLQQSTLDRVQIGHLYYGDAATLQLELLRSSGHLRSLTVEDVTVVDPVRFWHAIGAHAQQVKLLYVRALRRKCPTSDLQLGMHALLSCSHLSALWLHQASGTFGLAAIRILARLPALRVLHSGHTFEVNLAALTTLVQARSLAQWDTAGGLDAVEGPATRAALRCVLEKHPHFRLTAHAKQLQTTN